ncbi:tripartite tricarboxylate transporter substrate binding protein [Ramlibacter sp. 2FC]|uniref:Bug family tripartite tricarboxylate transporter substrate binding protein n=1 Tax=Ramlibacter sp. 2FC TaxID=2502188 RepID=UPI0010F5AD93|nr:tripartite tricarboxylate transporter substrate binding protein [Ramlibacter sp. 2FC]
MMSSNPFGHPARWLDRRQLLKSAAAGLATLPFGLHAQDYPSRPIRLVVPFPPGGPTDVLARIVATRLAEKLKQQVIVDNKPGASGMIGADMVAKAAPDGYTLLANASIHVINPSLYAKPRYDAIADFATVSNLADVPLVLAVHPKVPARSVKELVALAKSAKTPLAFASAGNATSQHLSGEAFKLAAGIDMLHVPYKGSAPALTDLVGGQVQLMFDSLPSSMPFIKSGAIRALAVTTPRRSLALPDVPTVAESGFPQFSISTWYGVWAPAGTPAGLVQRLSSEIAAIVRLPDVREQFASLGAEPVGNTPEEFAAFAKSELAKWARIVKQSGAKVD